MFDCDISPSGMQQNLRVPINAFIELLVSKRRIVERMVVRHDKAWLSAARYDQVPYKDANWELACHER